LERIAIIPFQVDRVQGRRPVLKSGRVAPEARVILTQLFLKLLTEREGYRVLSEAEVTATLSRFKDQERFVSSEKIQEIGKILKVDGVIIGNVDLYEEREGGPYGVERPAAVGFVAQFIRLQDGLLLWEGSYYERQKSLSEDVGTFMLFLQRGGRWVTARELAEFGVRKLLKNFPVRGLVERTDADHPSD
jgi:hypothetical protein